MSVAKIEEIFINSWMEEMSEEDRPTVFVELLTGIRNSIPIEYSTFDIYDGKEKDTFKLKKASIFAFTKNEMIRFITEINNTPKEDVAKFLDKFERMIFKPKK